MTKRFESLILVLTVTIAVCGQHTSATGQPADGLFKKGEEALAAGRLDEAVSIFTGLIDTRPSARLYYFRGLSLGTKHENSKAVADLDKAIAMEPGQVDYHFTRGVCLSRLGRMEPAVADMSEVLRLDPTDWQSLLYRAQFRFELKQAKAALAIQLKPDDAAGLRLLGDLLSYVGDHHKAVEAYDKAIRLNPQDAIAVNNRGVALANLGRHRQGLDDQKKAMDIVSSAPATIPVPTISGTAW